MRFHQKGFIDFLFLVVLIILIGAATYTVLRLQQADQTVTDTATNTLNQGGDTPRPTFHFTAAGDFGSANGAKQVLSEMGKTHSDFTLALGDLGYVGNGHEQQWCTFVKEQVGDDHPFELISGNHDDGTKDGDILEYANCLPNRLNDTVGTYGVEYYFDYQKLARVILISPDIGTYGFAYQKGDAHYRWVANAIDEARKQNIPWVIVAMHKNCITPGIKSCEIGEDIFNLMLEKHVNMVLQGHEHSYFRSKQLGLNKQCPAIMINAFNEHCVSRSGYTFSAQDGTLLIISGAGGRDLRDVNTTDAEIGYFETWNSANVDNSLGFSHFTVSADEIDAQFIPVTGDYVDTFSISIP